MLSHKVNVEPQNFYRKLQSDVAPLSTLQSAPACEPADIPGLRPLAATLAQVCRVTQSRLTYTVGSVLE